MWLIIILAAGLVCACMAAAWPQARVSREPASHEGLLAAELVSGELTRRQYRREMEQLAAADDERHPLSVPRDPGPANT